VRWQFTNTLIRLRALAQPDLYVPDVMKDLTRKAFTPLFRPLGFLHWTNTIPRTTQSAESSLVRCFRLLGRLGCQPNHIVDVGAHRGNWTREALRHFPNAYYTLLEPHTWLRADIEELLSLNPKVQWHNVTVGKSEGVLALTVAVDRSSSHISTDEAREL